MNKASRILGALALVLLAQCGGSTDELTGPALTCATTAALTNGSSVTAPSGSNVMAINVNSTGCNSYPNEPCVSVTICQPGTATCQTVNNILLDTGSFGLRIFKSLLTGVSLTGISQGGGTLAECVQYADLSSEWGRVALADLQLGGLTASNVPVHLVEYNYAPPPSACSTNSSIPDTDPTEAGFNGILGLGVFQYDCGPACVSSTNNGQYFTCTGGGVCTKASAALANQVQNPAPLLPSDNNGLIISMPTIPDNGAVSATGYLVLGIGTRSNNVPATTTTLATDGYGEFTTLFPFQNSAASYGFLDTGSTFYAFPQYSKTKLPFGTGTAGGLDLSALYCPSSTLQMQAANGSASCVPFTIGNAATLLGSGQRVFSDIGAYIGTISGFDYGLPFFFGRNVAVGFELKSSSLGTGPLVAY